MVSPQAIVTESVITRRVNCEAVEILKPFSDLARSAVVELPDLGSTVLIKRAASCGPSLEIIPVVASDGNGRVLKLAFRVFTSASHEGCAKY